MYNVRLVILLKPKLTRTHVLKTPSLQEFLTTVFPLAIFRRFFLPVLPEYCCYCCCFYCYLVSLVADSGSIVGESGRMRSGNDALFSSFGVS